MLNVMMSLMMLCSAQANDDVEARLKQMQDRLLKAEILVVRFDGVWNTNPERKIVGSMALSIKQRTFRGENNVRDREPYTKTMNGDGVVKLTESAREAIGRAGTFVPLYLLENFGDDVTKHSRWFTDPEQMDRSVVKLGDTVKLGERVAQIVEFTLTSKNGKLAIRNKVWIDSERRHLPIQWETTSTRGKKRISVMEKYEKIELAQ